MITTIVQFTLPQPMTRDEARKVFQSTAPKYRGLPGLVRKYYIVADDGRTAGGVYLWNSRADAQAVYTDEWRAFVTGKYMIGEKALNSFAFHGPYRNIGFAVDPQPLRATTFVAGESVDSEGVITNNAGKHL